MRSTKRTRGTISFILRKSTKTEQPISLCYSYGRGKRFVYAIGYSINLKWWDKKKQRIKNVVAVRDSNEINDLMRDLESELEKFVTNCDAKQIQLSNNLMRETLDEYTNKHIEDDKRINLLQSIINHNNRKEKELPKPKSGQINQTVKSYKQTYKHINEFIDQTGYILDFDTVDEEFRAEFVEYMSKKTHGKAQRYYHLNTIGKHIKNFKAFMSDALYKGLHTNIKYQRFKVPKEITTAIYLTKKEVKMIADLKLKESHLILARDVFIIGCEIGQRISDYHNLGQNTIKEINGERYIEIKQEKTDKQVLCHITPRIQKIMHKRYEGKLPPKITKQKINDYIKIVGEKAGLIEDIKIESTIGGKPTINTKPKFIMIMGHTARRTFCTLKHKAGMPVHDIMQLSGHTTEKEFMKYIRNPQDERITQIIGTDAYQNSTKS